MVSRLFERASKMSVLILSNGSEIPIWRGHWIASSPYKKQFVLGRSNPNEGEEHTEGYHKHRCPKCGS
jgi:hypothetical protein